MRAKTIFLYLFILFLIIIISTNAMWHNLNRIYNSKLYHNRKISSLNMCKQKDHQVNMIGAFDPLDEAQFIRNIAGVPKNETTGILSHIKPGIAGLLEDSERIQILSYIDAQLKSSSGSGTKEDPFIIKDKRLDNSENSQDPAGIYIFDPFGNYYINIKNCEIFGYFNCQIYINIKVDVLISNCSIYSNGYGIIQEGGNLKVFETHFSGLEKGGILASSEQKNSLILKNSLFNSDSEEWGISSKGIYTDGTGLINISYSSIENANSLRFLSIYKATKLIFRNCYLANIETALFRHNKAPGFISNDSILKYLEIINTSQTSINLLGQSHLEISYCSISDSAPDYRLILFTNSDDHLPEDIIIHHCKFTDSVGSGKPGNECLEVFYGKNIEIHHNWVTECSEDAYELTCPRPGCSIYNNVGDNVKKQIVDIYQAFGNEEELASHGGYVGTYIHHIYGNSFKDCAVRITDADGVLIHDIYASCGALYSVILEQRYGTLSTTPTNCRIIEPIINYLPNSSKIGFEGIIGPGNIFINLSFKITKIDINNNIIYLKGKSFELTTNNPYFTYLSIFKFLEKWTTFNESAMEWFEECNNNTIINYTINIGLPNAIFRLERKLNGMWEKIHTFEAEKNGSLKFSNYGYSNYQLRLILDSISLKNINFELNFFLIILIILIFLDIRRKIKN